MCGFMSPGVCLLCQGMGTPDLRSAWKNRSESQQASGTCRADFLLDPFGERTYHTGQDPRLSDGDRGAFDLLAEQKIFGKDFAYIKDIRNFSRVTGAYLKKQVLNA